ncbi:PTS sugar transporter subunit IIA [Lysobacter sp. A289]
MPLHQLLDGDRIAIVPGSHTRATVIDTAARMLATQDDYPSIRDSLRSRERLASTAIGHGVAIPHGRTGLVGHTRGAFLHLLKPVDFGALDGQPVDLVLAMVVPEHFVHEHLEQLAELAEQFSVTGFCAHLRQAGNVDELRRRLLQPLAHPQVA